MITDQMLRDAAEELNRALLDTIPEPIIKHNFSKKFNNKIKRLVHKSEHPLLYKTIRSAACTALVLLLSWMLIITVSPKVRAKMFAWIKEQYSNFIEYTIPENTAYDEPLKHFELSPPPDGYEKSSEYLTVDLHSILYSNEKNEQIHLIYTPLKNTSNIFIKNAESQYSETSIAGYQADYYQSANHKESNILIWYDNDNNYIFYLSAKMEKEMLKDLAENIYKK